MDCMRALQRRTLDNKAAYIGMSFISANTYIMQIEQCVYAQSGFKIKYISMDLGTEMKD